MIGVILPQGHAVANLLYYLYGPGKACEHVSPHLVSGWRHPAELEPPLRPDGRRDFRRLTSLLTQPVTALGDRAPREPVWHCAVRAAPGDPELGDGAWMAIAAEIMHRTGLSPRGQEDEAARWVAVHHGGNHIHIVATLARQDGRRATQHNERWRLGAALRDIEREYGLQILARADRTAAKNPTRAEQEKAARAGQSEPPRVTLRRHVAAAAARTRSEPEFWAELARRGVHVQLRHSTRHEHEHEVTGYAVALDTGRTAAGDLIWFGGGQLAPDLTWPKLRHRWAPGPGPARNRARTRPGPGPTTGPGPGPGPRARLHGHGMNNQAARTALRREVARCATTARTEPAFFAGLQQAGLLTRIRYHPDRPGEAAGYAVSLPGLTHQRDGHQVWYGGQTLDPALSLPVLRRRWQAGRPGAPAQAGLFANADAASIFGYAAGVATAATRQLRATPEAAAAADIAWAAADVLAVAADATGSADLRQAADRFSRAARASWGRIPAPSVPGAGLRTAAYLLASCHPGGHRRGVARMALITVLSDLARALADLRAAQQRLLQAAAARQAAQDLAAAAAVTGPAPAGAPLAAADSAAPPVTARPAPARPRPGTRRRAGPGRPVVPPRPRRSR